MGIRPSVSQIDLPLLHFQFISLRLNCTALVFLGLWCTAQGQYIAYYDMYKGSEHISSLPEKQRISNCTAAHSVNVRSKFVISLTHQSRPTRIVSNSCTQRTFFQIKARSLSESCFIVLLMNTTCIITHKIVVCRALCTGKSTERYICTC